MLDGPDAVVVDVRRFGLEGFDLVCPHCSTPATHRVQWRWSRRGTVYGCEDYVTALATSSIVEGGTP